LPGAAALAGIVAEPMRAFSLPVHTHSNAAIGFTPAGLSPSQVAEAYGFDQVSGGATSGGAGQTIAIVDAYDDPNISQDLATFDQQYGLAAPPSFTKNYAAGVRPQTDAGWSQEIALDVEWAHAMAPKANIVLVEAASANLNDLLSAVNTARNLTSVSVVSMSWGTQEFQQETSYDSYFTTPAGHIGITFVGASGDSGAPGIWPALSPNALAVGGTTLHVTSAGYGSETGWANSGGGVSNYENEPSYQTAVQSYGARSTPDVAFNADPNSGFAVYDSVTGAGSTGWMVVGGTSAGAPQWSALIAIADQARVAAGKATLDQAQNAIYGLPSSDFHEITSGNNGYQATPGYNLVTGLGSPIANLLVQDLVTPPTTTGGGVATGGGTRNGGGTGTGGTGNGSNPYDPFGSSPYGGYDPWGGIFGGYDPWSWFFGGGFGGLGFGGYSFGGYGLYTGYDFTWGGAWSSVSYNPWAGGDSGGGFSGYLTVGRNDMVAGGGSAAATSAAVGNGGQANCGSLTNAAVQGGALATTGADGAVPGTIDSSSVGAPVGDAEFAGATSGSPAMVAPNSPTSGVPGNGVSSMVARGAPLAVESTSIGQRSVDAAFGEWDEPLA
jgi:hypothetical protein